MTKKVFLAGLRTSNVPSIGSHTTLKIWRGENGSLVFAIVEENGMGHATCSREVSLVHPSSGWPTDKVYQKALELADVIDNERRAHPEFQDFVPGQNHH